MRLCALQGLALVSQSHPADLAPVTAPCAPLDPPMLVGAGRPLFAKWSSLLLLPGIRDYRGSTGLGHTVPYHPFPQLRSVDQNGLSVQGLN